MTPGASSSSSPNSGKARVTEACADRSEEAPLLSEPTATPNYGLAIEREFEVHDIGISVD
ncbi:hypothetical protein GGI06_006620, partial [Coemansia sp. S85]